ncbi:unnamed protein product [Boreogadus saida]
MESSPVQRGGEIPAPPWLPSTVDREYSSPVHREESAGPRWGTDGAEPQTEPSVSGPTGSSPWNPELSVVSGALLGPSAAVSVLMPREIEILSTVESGAGDRRAESETGELRRARCWQRSEEETERLSRPSQLRGLWVGSRSSNTRPSTEF